MVYFEETGTYQAKQIKQMKDRQQEHGSSATSDSVVVEEDSDPDEWAYPDAWEDEKSED